MRVGPLVDVPCATPPPPQELQDCTRSTAHDFKEGVGGWCEVVCENAPAEDTHRGEGGGGAGMY